MPQLDKGFEVFANWQTILFSIGVFMVTYVTRIIVEYAWKNWKQSKLYNELILHLFPIVVGGLIALAAKKFPWPMPIVDSASARIFYGAVLGMFCGAIYGRVRAWITSNTSINIPLPSPDAVVLPPAAESETKESENTPIVK